MGRNAVLQVALEQPPARLGRGGVAELVAERREPAGAARRHRDRSAARPAV